MTGNQLLARMQAVPYLRNGSDFLGCDCWGWIEIWHRLIHGVEVTDRKGQQGSPDGFYEGFQAKSAWQPSKPENSAVWTAKALTDDGQIIEHGHCGIVWNGYAYHMHHVGGFCRSRLDDRKLRVSGFWKHECIL